MCRHLCRFEQRRDCQQSRSKDRGTAALTWANYVAARTEAGHRNHPSAEPTHLLAALLQPQGSVIAQAEVDAKTNEIPALRELLAPLAIDGRVVTADALHTQRETARFLIEEKNAHYLFTLKDNQKTLAKDCAAYDWESIPPSAPQHR